MFRTGVVIFTVLMALSFSAGAQDEPFEPGLSVDRVFEHDGLERTYDIFVPEGGAEPLSLVVDLHGTFSSARQQRSDSRFDEVAANQGFVVVWPDSLGVEWKSFARFGPDGVDDVGFLLALVDEIAARLEIDPARIYATGLSNGGAMTQRLACDGADTFAAFVALAPATPAGALGACTPVRPVPMLTVRGTTDQLLPFAGGQTAEVAGNQFEVRSAEAEREWWRELAGCQGPAPDVVSEPGATSQCTRYTSCDAGVEVGMCSVQSDGSFNHVLYQNLDDFDLAAKAWEFMQDFTLPAEFADSFGIDSRIEGNWTRGDVGTQGLMFDYIDAAEVLFVGWFTYTAVPVEPIDPPEPGIGAPGQRWLVAPLEVEGATASGELLAPAGGGFEMPETMFQVSPVVGSMEIEFLGCDLARVSYSIDTGGVSGSFEVEPVEQIVAGDVFECSPRAPGAG